MKQRFSSLDVAVIAHELSHTLVGLRVTNIYDLSSKIFLLKFALPNQRHQLLLDSGFRCHLTNYARTAASTPSQFVARLRKSLRTRRVTSIRQIGTDRVLEFQFSDGMYRLFLEFYAAGNVVLTDREFNIIACLRAVSAAEGEEVRVGGTYVLERKQNYAGLPGLDVERVRKSLSDFLEKEVAAAAGSKRKGKKVDPLKRALTEKFPEMPAVLFDHALRIRTFDTTLPLNTVLDDNDLLEQLFLVVKEAEKVMKEIISVDHPKGYIIAKRYNQKNITTPPDDPKDNSGYLYDDFHPFKPLQFEEDPNLTILEYDGFNGTVDEFYSSLESQKLESRLTEREAHAKRKLDVAKEDQLKRLGALQDLQALNVRKAEAIGANIERVEEAMGAINSLIAQGMDWVEIAKLIEMEQKRGNPVARIIKLPLKLYENTVTLLLFEPDLEPEEEEGYQTESEEASEDEDDQKGTSIRVPKEADKSLAIDVDLGLTPWSNATQYYDQKKSAAQKEQKTLQSSTKALQSTERKINADLKKELKQEKQVLRPARKQLWFEKFIFFISSDGYLVIGGRDAQQNEILYRRYLKKGDVYVHADLQGAASVIVKNKTSTPDAPIPPSTLSQAGTLSVCTSSAWDSKAVMGAWWVNADQVSKSAPTGEFLSTGGFMIRGKKNFLPPAQLILGFGVMWQISEESKAKHVKHRLHDIESPNHSSSKEKVSDEVVSDGESQNNDYFVEQGEGEAAAEMETKEPDQEQDEDDPDGRDSEREFNPLQNRHQPSEVLPSDQAAGVDEAEKQPRSTIDTDIPEDSGVPEGGHDSGPDYGIEKTEFQMTGARTETSANPAASTAPPDKPTTKHLSAKQRRLLKKGKPIDSVSSSNLTNQSTLGISDSDAPPSQPRGTSTPSLNSAGPQPRGKQSKAKKAASKYAHQDEEDRAIAMRLLGSTGEKKTVEATANKAAKEAEAEFQRQRRREQHRRNAARTKEHEEVRKLMMTEEGVEELDETEQAQMDALDRLVGTCLPGDDIVAAIPVCAPWNALGRYKYKVKLQPGMVKKGKAVREILSKWIDVGKMGKKVVDEEGKDVERLWPRELDLIRGWREAEIVGVVPVGKVRIISSGGGGGGGQKGKNAQGWKGGKKR